LVLEGERGSGRIITGSDSAGSCAGPAGYDRNGALVNADAGIGAVALAGSWRASSLAAGASPGADGFFGTADDELISGGSSVVARIASILIKGSASGSADEESGRFGFVAEEIGAFSAGSLKLPLTSGPRNDLSGVKIGGSSNLTPREVGLSLTKRSACDREVSCILNVFRPCCSM
jgi:hypothetical protein